MNSILAIPAISARNAKQFLPTADGNIQMLWHSYADSIDYALPDNAAAFNFHALAPANNLAHYKNSFWNNNADKLAKLLPRYDNVLLGLPCTEMPVPFEYVLNASKQPNIEQQCDSWFEADIATINSSNCKIAHVLDKGQADALIDAGIAASKIELGKYRYINKQWLKEQISWMPLFKCDALITFKYIAEHMPLLAKLACYADKQFIATSATNPTKIAANIKTVKFPKSQLFSFYQQGAAIVPYGRHEKIYRLGIAEALSLGAKLYNL